MLVESEGMGVGKAEIQVLGNWVKGDSLHWDKEQRRWSLCVSVCVCVCIGELEDSLKHLSDIQLKKLEGR